MMVSIGVPIYNGEKYLHYAISSILAQTYEDFELILSDDGSSDNSLAIIKSYKDSRIRIISDGINRGISYRLNEQIAIARGKYYFRMDADDLMLKNRVFTQVAFLEAHPSVDVVGSEAIIINELNKIIGTRTPKLQQQMISYYVKSPFIHPTIAGKTSWFKANPYSLEYNGIEDLELWARAVSYSQYAVINEPLLFYRDPLKVDYSTYIFRTERIVRLINRNKDTIGRIKAFKYEIKIWTKMIVYALLIFARKSNHVVNKRNMIMNHTNTNHYNKILKQLIDKAIEN